MNPITNPIEGAPTPGSENPLSSKKEVSAWQTQPHKDKFMWNPETVKKPIELFGVQNETQPDRLEAYEELVLCMSADSLSESGELADELVDILNKYDIYDKDAFSGISPKIKTDTILPILLDRLIRKEDGLRKTGHEDSSDVRAVIATIKMIDKQLDPNNKDMGQVDRLIALSDLLLPEYSYLKPGEHVTYQEPGDLGATGHTHTEAMPNLTEVMPDIEDPKSPESPRSNKIITGFANFFKTVREWTIGRALTGVEQITRERVDRFGELRERRARVREERRRAEDNLQDASYVADLLSSRMALSFTGESPETIIKGSLGLGEGASNADVISELKRLIGLVDRKRYVKEWIEVVGPLDHALGYMEDVVAQEYTVKIPNAGSPTT